MVWYLAKSHVFEECIFCTLLYIDISVHELAKSDKTLALASLTLVCKLKIDWKTWPRISSQAYSRIRIYTKVEGKRYIWTHRVSNVRYWVTRVQIFRIFTFSNVSRKMKPSGIFIGWGILTLKQHFGFQCQSIIKCIFWLIHHQIHSFGNRYIFAQIVQVFQR